MKMKNTLTIAILLIINLLSYSAFTQSWTPVSNMADGRYGAVSFSIGDKGYVAIGQNSTTTKSSVWEYNPIDDTWSQKADFGGGNRRVAFGFNIGDKGYIGTGRDNSGTNGNGVLHNDFWEFDPISNTWIQKSNFGGGNREAAISFVIGDYGYAGLGLSGGRDYDFWKYDPSTDTWSQLQDIDPNFHLYNSVSFVINNYAYYGLGFGFSYDPYGSYTSNEIFKYDPSTDTWSQLNNFGGTARQYATSFILDGSAYVGLGYSGTYLEDFWKYDETNDVWEQTNISGISRARVSAFSIGDDIYLGNGLSSSQTYQDFYILDGNSLSINKKKEKEKTLILADETGLDIHLSQYECCEYKIVLYDLTGKIIMSTDTIPINGKISISKYLNEGIYIISLKNLNNGTKYIKQIIVT